MSIGGLAATTRLADLILPSAMWVEKNGMYGNSHPGMKDNDGKCAVKVYRAGVARG
jgi:anaerobic selenocysteine-containing dehydrogenase